jgi:hypothetical protein
MSFLMFQTKIQRHTCKITLIAKVINIYGNLPSMAKQGKEYADSFSKITFFL